MQNSQFQFLMVFFSFNLELEEIRIIKTKITKLPEDFLKNLKILIYVHIHGNLISSIPENFFSDNEKLEWILLGNNKISELPKTFLKRLSESLQTIDLSYNPMSYIPVENFFTENGNFKNKIKKFKPRQIVCGNNFLKNYNNLAKIDFIQTI